MDFGVLGNIGEFVGAIAVVASLLYLATQMRQNSQLVRTTAYQTSSDWTLTALGLVAQSPETARLFAQGLVDPRTLDEAERVQFSMLMNITFTGLANQFINWKRGVLALENWQHMESIALWYMEQSGVQRWLAGSGNRVNPDFIAHMHAVMNRRSTANDGYST